MPTTPVNSATILRDTIFAIKNFLSGAISDPIVNRPGGESFIMTSYPTRATTFPIITIKDVNTSDNYRLGLQSEATWHTVDMEVRIWANNVAQRDQLADSVFNNMRTNQFGGGSAWSTDYDIHDGIMLSSINVDDPSGPKSKVQTYRFMFVAT